MLWIVSNSLCTSLWLYWTVFGHRVLSHAVCVAGLLFALAMTAWSVAAYRSER